MSTEEVMDENCLGRWRRGWSSGNMSSSSASSAVHAQRLIVRANFLLDVCASKFRNENKANFDLSTSVAWLVMAVPLRCQFPGNPFSGIVYVTSRTPPLTDWSGSAWDRVFLAHAPWFTSAKSYTASILFFSSHGTAMKLGLQGIWSCRDSRRGRT